MRSRVQYVFIDSASARGTPSDFEVSVPDRALQCTPSQIIRITLRRFTFQNTLWNIVPGDALVVDATSYPLVPGTYTVDEAQQMFNAISVAIKVQYDRLRNIFVFTSTVPAVCEFIGLVRPFFGTPGSFLVLPDEPFEGEQVRPAIPSIVLSFDDPMVFPDEANWFCINREATLRNSLILGNVPIVVPPREMVNYVNIVDDGEITVIAKKYDTLKFSIRDTLGNTVYGLPHVQFLLKFEIAEALTVEPLHQELRALNRSVQLLVRTAAVDYMRRSDGDEDAEITRLMG